MKYTIDADAPVKTATKSKISDRLQCKELMGDERDDYVIPIYGPAHNVSQWRSLTMISPKVTLRLRRCAV